MNRDICHKCSKPVELCDCPTGTTYDLLRRQHEAIQKLREALAWYIKEDDVQEGDELNAYWVAGLRRAEQALKDTEGL